MPVVAARSDVRAGRCPGRSTSARAARATALTTKTTVWLAPRPLSTKAQDRSRDRDHRHDAGRPAEDRGQRRERVHGQSGPEAVTRPSYRGGRGRRGGGAAARSRPRPGARRRRGRPRRDERLDLGPAAGQRRASSAVGRSPARCQSPTTIDELAPRRDPTARPRPRQGRRASRARSARGPWSARGRRPRDGPPRTPRPGRAGSPRPGPAPRTRPSRGRRPRSGRAARAARDPTAAGTPRTSSAARPRPTRRPRPARRDAPGIGTTRPPSPAHAATSSPPGSLTAGVPASVTSARSAPPRRCSSSASSARRLAPGVVARHPRRDGVPVEQPMRVARVLGRDQRDGPQDVERPERDVAEVPDRRGDDVQRPAAARALRPLPSPVIRRGPTPAGVADRGSRRRPSAARAWRSAGPAA